MQKKIVLAHLVLLISKEHENLLLLSVCHEIYYTLDLNLMIIISLNYLQHLVFDSYNVLKK